MIMWLSVLLVHGAGGLISQWVSTIKSAWVFTVASQYPTWHYLGYGQDINLQRHINFHAGSSLPCSEKAKSWVWVQGQPASCLIRQSVVLHFIFITKRVTLDRLLIWKCQTLISTVFELYHGVWDENEKATAYSLATHTIQAWYEGNWPLMTLEVIHTEQMDCSTAK